MSTNEFDRLIAKNVSQASYEYDAGDWEKLIVQLSAARRKKRVLLFAYYTSGIAASVAIFLMCVISMFSEKESTAVSYTSKLKAATANPLTLSANNEINRPSPGKQHIWKHNSAVFIAHQKQAYSAPDTVAYNAPVFVYNNLTENTSAPSEKKQIDTAGSEQKGRPQDYDPFRSLSYTETANKSNTGDINVSVAGGVSYGMSNTGYAVGAAVGKKLNNKLGIELTVAYVGNVASTTGSQNTGIYLPPSPATVVTSPLNYVQFAPMVDYSLSKKVALSAGADVQRLLETQEVTVLYNDNTKIAPLIDLGMLLRTEYAIYPRLKAGLSYRIGVNNIIAPGNNYFDRNYMQIQLKYKLR